MGIIGTHDGFVPGPLDIYNRGSWGSGYSVKDFTAIPRGDLTYNPSPGSTGYSGSVTAESSALKFNFAKNSGVRGDLYGYCKLSKLINFTPYSTLNFTVSNIVNYHDSEYANEWKDDETYAYIIGTSGNKLAELMYYKGPGVDSGTSAKPTGELTKQINISGINISGYIVILLYGHNTISRWSDDSLSGMAYLQRLWFT